jgi:hypothetical protein
MAQEGLLAKAEAREVLELIPVPIGDLKVKIRHEKGHGKRDGIYGRPLNGSEGKSKHPRETPFFIKIHEARNGHIVDERVVIGGEDSQEPVAIFLGAGVAIKGVHAKDEISRAVE